MFFFDNHFLISYCDSTTPLTEATMVHRGGLRNSSAILATLKSLIDIDTDTDKNQLLVICIIYQASIQECKQKQCP